MVIGTFDTSTQTLFGRQPITEICGKLYNNVVQLKVLIWNLIWFKVKTVSEVSTAVLNNYVSTMTV